MSDMTREEAIDTLEMLRFPEPWEQKLTKRAEEALDMAILALSEELSEDGTLTVHVSDGSKVKRVFVMGENIFGGLYYPDSAENNVGMSMSHRAIAKVISDYIANHKGDSDKQYTAYEIRALLISDESDNKGEWIEHRTKNGTVVALTCPKCLKSPKNAVRSDFCPNCGADMRPEPYKAEKGE